jgi:outer membrane protein assembly factor BamD (BamD/ComL family)
LSRRFKEEIMSESLNDHRATAMRRSLPFLIVTSGVVAILLLAYLGGYLILPGAIQSTYQANNCESVLVRGDLYARLYPFATSQADLFETVQECAVYTLALMNEKESAWRDAYHAFTVYTASYPDGRFADDVHERTASVLMRLAREEITVKKHADALQKIDLVLNDFSDTDAAQEAEGVKFDLFMDWGADLRETRNYAEAEALFIQLQANAPSAIARSAQLELAQTYLEWGLDMGTQRNFAEAKMKFDLAASTDPGGGPSGKVEASLRQLYAQWGDHLIEQGDYSNGMGQYETAAALTRDADPTAASEIIVGGYLQWSAALSKNEDFLGALVVLDFAQQAAATDEARARVDTARSDLYLAFSQSDGEQAQKAMLDAAKSVCRHHVAPRLPIFGLDAENVGTLVDGAEGELPAEIAATTPGSMHYVACVQEENKVAGTAVHAVGSFVFDQTPPYRSVQVLYKSFQYLWTVTLRKVDSGDEAQATVIDGGEPPRLPSTPREIYEGATSPNYYGEKPEFSDLADWLETALK